MNKLYKASDAAQAQYAFADWLKRNPDIAGKNQAKFLRAFFGTETALQQFGIGSEDALHAYAAYRYMEQLSAFRSSTPVFFTSESIALCNEAAGLLPDDEILLASEVTDHNITIWLQDPQPYEILLSTNEGDNKVVEQWKINAIQIRSRADIPAEVTDTTDKSVTSGIELHLWGTPAAADIDPDVYRATTGGLTLFDLTAIQYGRSWASLNFPPWITSLKRLIIAMFRLMGDHIEKERVHLSRNERRRLTRLGLPLDGYIVEVKLRKAVYADSGDFGSGTPLRFRHRVRGHWRKVYCPSKGPVGDPEAYRYSFVNDYVRGPKESPVVESTRVVAVVR